MNTTRRANEKGIIPIFVVIAILLSPVNAGTVFRLAQTRQRDLLASMIPALSTPAPGPVSPASTATLASSTAAPQVTESSTPPALGSRVVSVSDLYKNEEAYVGTSVRVRGKISIFRTASEVVCPSPGTPCPRSGSATVLLVETNGAGRSFSIYLNGKPYPCNEDRLQTRSCGEFINGSTVTISAVFRAIRIPDQGIDNKVTKWRDAYYLDLK